MNSFLFTFLVFGLFSHKENKEQKVLHNHAETAFSRLDYVSAKKAYEELCKKIEKPEDDWQNYVDIIVRYAEVHLLLKEYSLGEALLNELLEKKPPYEFHPRIVVLLGRIHSFQEQAGKGYIKMHEATLHIPLEKWRPEERSFFHAVEYALNAYYENLLQKAKHFAAAASYEEAITAYEKINQGIELNYFPSALKSSLIKKKVIFRLAECHFLSANFEKTLSLTHQISPPHDCFDAEMLYLAALCYKEKREYEKSLLCLQNYLSTQDSNLLFHYDCALFEVGQFYYRNGNKEKAKEYLQRLTEHKGNHSRPVLIGSLYLGKIFCSEKKFNEAESLFSFVQSCLGLDDPLFFEATYYQGEAFFEKKQYQKASCCFEQALSSSTSKGDWTKRALYKLALCYSRQNDPELLKKGENILEKFLKHEFDEEMALALADLYACEKNIQKFENFKSHIVSLLSEEGQKELLLLECTLQTSSQNKSHILGKIIEEGALLSKELRAKALYFQALNDLSLGIETEGKKEFYLRKALSSLEKAFSLIEKCDENAASQVLRLEIQAHCLLKDQSLILSLLQRLNQDLENKERLYLKALLLSQMDNREDKVLAAQTFEELFTLYPSSEFADDALYALATFYYKQENFALAEEYFIQLVEKYPASSYAEVGYYWAAEAAEKKGDPPQKCRLLRKDCFEKYPCSPKGADAYFKYFTLDDYLEGNEEALLHLQSFSTLFPHSSLLSIVYFLIAFHESSYPLAKAHFEKALELFNSTISEESSLTLFRYKTMLELARLDMRYGKDMNYALKMLLNLVSELRDMPSYLKEKTSYPSIYEESEFALFQIYCGLKKETLAYEVLLSMLKHYSEAGINEGYYLSQVWKEHGLLTLNAKDFSTALSCFQIACESGEKYLNAEEKFFLFISQSECYRALNQYDEAMKALSQVINNDIDSHLRLKAMFLRSEIYELQGRHELSYRQLLSLAKLEGKWALEAKEKLKRLYGIHE